MRPLVLSWQQSHDSGTLQTIILECRDLIDAIIRRYRFHDHYPLTDLVNDCVVRLPEIIDKFDPKIGTCFTFLTASLKNYLLKHIGKMRLRTRTQVPISVIAPDNPNSETPQGGMLTRLESLAKAIPEESRDAALDSVYSLSIRFFDRKAHKVLRYYLEAIEERGFNGVYKNQLQSTAVVMYGITGKRAQFLYDYLVVRLRQMFYDHYVTGVHELDLLSDPRGQTLVPELVQAIGHEATMKLVHIFGGKSITLPTIGQLQKMHDTLAMCRESDESAAPTHQEAVAKKHKLTSKESVTIRRQMYRKLCALPRKPLEMAAATS